MADTLETVVQRMIDAGVPEDTIISVLQKTNGDPERTDVMARNLPREQDTFSQGFHEGLKQPGNTAAGIVTGAVEGVPEGLSNIAGVAKTGLTKLLHPVQTAGELYDAATAPAEPPPDMLHPKSFSEGGERTLADVQQDPESFGKRIGAEATELGAGMTASKLIPLGVKAGARSVGPAVQAFGKQAKFPFRIGGSAAIMSGNVPGGVALMAAPTVLEKGGEALSRYGTEEGAALIDPRAKLLKLETDFKAGTVSADDVMKEVKNHQVGLADRLAKAKLPADVEAVKKEQSALDKLSRIASKKPQGVETGGLSADQQALFDRLQALNESRSAVKKSAVRIAPTANPVPTPTVDAPAPYEIENEAFRARMQPKLDALKKPVAAPVEPPVEAAPVSDAVPAPTGEVRPPAEVLDPEAQALRDGTASTVTEPPAAKPAVRIAVPPVSLKSVTPGGLDRVAASLKQAFGDEIEQLRTEHGATEAAEILQRNHPAELGKMKRGELTTLIRKVSGGEAGLLPEGARAEIDAKMAGMDRAAQEAYLLKSGDKNAAAYKYVASKMGMKPND